MIDSERLPDESDRRANQDAVRQAEGGVRAPFDVALGVKPGEMRRHALGALIERLSRSRRLMNRCVMLAFRLEGGQYWSATAREILRRRCGVMIGAYSYGECFVPYAFPPGTRVGRYVSIANGVRIFPRNHPMDRVSTHPFFFNALMGVVEKDNVESNRFVIESDAWIGENAIFTPGCKRVGVGAVVGAGAVVTKDVPDFAIVVGNPAKVIRMRFDEQTCAAVLASRWWERTLEECRAYLAEMTKPVGDWREQRVLKGSAEC